MAEVSLLETVKIRIGITGEFQNDRIQGYIDDIKQYLLDGGVEREIVEAPSSAGVIVRGVYDLYYNDNLSSYFIERASQLSYKEVDKND